MTTENSPSAVHQPATPRDRPNGDLDAASDPSEADKTPKTVAETSASEEITPEEGQAADSEVAFAPSEQLPVLAVTEVQRALQQVVDGIQTLQRAFDSKIRYDESKQQTIDALHKELQLHREGLHFRLLRPIFLDLIGMYSDLNELLKHADRDTPFSATEARQLRNLQSFQGSIEEILYRNGVETYAEDGDKFVAQRQRSVKIIETDRSDLDGMIAESVRKGFMYDNRVLRPEAVVVYKFAEQYQEVKEQ